jgi:predicted lipoprotein with Yx(FWY)xxD motif
MASGAMAEPSGSMMDDSGSAMMTEDSMHPASEAMTAEMSPAGGAPGITIATAGSDFGQVLFDGTGQAIYLFGKETTPVPDCYGDCAVAWPPVLAEGSPVAGTGTMADLLGTAPRTDGSIQVTYAGHPLYYYAHEGKNVVTCHNVSEFGGLWLVVTPTGEPAA